MICPDDNTIARFSDGALSEEAAVSLELHVDGCASCREVLAAFGRSYGSARQRSSGSEPSWQGASSAAFIPFLPRGTAVGRYVVLGPLGSGGMGVVYQAYDPDLDRKLALKLVRPKDTPPARLLGEAQAMARLSHPNVIAIYDVGEFRGCVFLAMELIEGPTLRSWIKRRARWMEIVPVFVQAGRGLAAAHAAGIVHRDFKPDNVLVGDDGRVCVTDFGLAQASDASALASGGTPAYMSPEQRRGELDARGDQFAFCVALHEALAGEHPDRAAPGDVVARLPAGLPRWLRAVVERGLATRPEDRHPSMNALLVELARDRRRRARRWVALGGAVLLLAGAVATTATVQSRRALLCTGASARLVGVWDPPTRARLRERFAQSGRPYALDSLAEVERQLDRFTASFVAMHTEACEATRQRGEQSDEVLSLRMACLETRRAELAALTRVLATADGGVIERAVQAAGALSPLDRCADVTALLQTIRPPERPELARAVAALRARLVELKALHDSGQFARALPPARQLVDDARTLAYPPVLAEALYRLGTLDSSASERAAKDTLAEAVWVAHAAKHDEIAARASVAALSAALFADDKAAAKQWRDYAEAALVRGGDDGALRADLLSGEASLLGSEGQTGPAIARSQQAVALAREHLGASSPSLVALLNSLGLHYLDEAATKQAAPYLNEALALAERHYGAAHPWTARVLLSLAFAAQLDGNYDLAVAHDERARAILEAALGPDHSEVAGCLEGLANVLAEQGHFAQALTYYQRVLEIRRRTLGPSHEFVGIALTNLGSFYSSRKQHDEAERHFAAALPILEKALSPTHPSVAVCLVGLGQSAAALGRSPSAAAAFARALAILEPLGTDELSLAQARFGLARALAERDAPRANRLARLARAGFAAIGPKAHAEQAEVADWLRHH